MMPSMAMLAMELMLAAKATSQTLSIPLAFRVPVSRKKRASAEYKILALALFFAPWTTEDRQIEGSFTRHKQPSTRGPESLNLH